MASKPSAFSVQQQLFSIYIMRHANTAWTCLIVSLANGHDRCLKPWQNIQSQSSKSSGYCADLSGHDAVTCGALAEHHFTYEMLLQESELETERRSQPVTSPSTKQLCARCHIDSNTYINKIEKPWDLCRGLSYSASFDKQTLAQLYI